MDLQKSWRLNSDVNRANKFTVVLLIIYLILLFWILLLKLGVPFSYMENRHVNLMPFNGHFLNGESILNVVVFVPLGIYAGILFKRWHFGKQLFFFFIFSLLVEALQYMLAIGAFYITDIITNTTGGVIGYILFIAIQKAFNNTTKAHQFINIVAAIATACIVLLLLFLKLNMLPIRYQ